MRVIIISAFQLCLGGGEGCVRVGGDRAPPAMPGLRERPACVSPCGCGGGGGNGGSAVTRKRRAIMITQDHEGAVGLLLQRAHVCLA